MGEVKIQQMKTAAPVRRAMADDLRICPNASRRAVWFNATVPNVKREAWWNMLQRVGAGGVVADEVAVFVEEANAATAK